MCLGLTNGYIEPKRASVPRNENTCVCCGASIPEGGLVCSKCYKSVKAYNEINFYCQYMDAYIICGKESCSMSCEHYAQAQRKNKRIKN